MAPYPSSRASWTCDWSLGCLYSFYPLVTNWTFDKDGLCLPRTADRPDLTLHPHHRPMHTDRVVLIYSTLCHRILGRSPPSLRVYSLPQTLFPMTVSTWFFAADWICRLLRDGTAIDTYKAFNVGRGDRHRYLASTSRHVPWHPESPRIPLPSST